MTLSHNHIVVYISVLKIMVLKGHKMDAFFPFLQEVGLCEGLPFSCPFEFSVWFFDFFQ